MSLRGHVIIFECSQMVDSKPVPNRFNEAIVSPTIIGQCYKKVTMVIYCHSIALMAFCVIKQYYHVNYHRMSVNYHGKMFQNIGPWGSLKNCGNIL
jgi:hypothetical protein